MKFGIVDSINNPEQWPFQTNIEGQLFDQKNLLRQDDWLMEDKENKAVDFWIPYQTKAQEQWYYAAQIARMRCQMTKHQKHILFICSITKILFLCKSYYKLSKKNKTCIQF